MGYKNVVGSFFGLVTKHACDGGTDGQNYDSQDRAGIARAVIKLIMYKLIIRKSLVNAVFFLEHILLHMMCS